MVKYIKFFLRFSKIILVALVGITIFLAIRATRVKFDFSVESLFRSGSKERGEYEWFRKNFGSDDSVIFVAYKAPDVLGPAMQEYAGHLTGRLTRVSGVHAVFSVKDAFDFYRKYEEFIPRADRDAYRAFLRDEMTTNPLFRGNVISADGRTTCLWVVIKPEMDTEDKRAGLFEEVRRILREEEKDSGLRFFAAGIPVIEHEYVVLTKRDILTFMPLAVAVFFLLLCIYFRNVMGTFLPLATVGMAVVWTVGLMQIFGLTISILSSIIPNLILIVGIADSIHILSRYQEEGKLVADKREALARTIVVMVPACFLTSFTTAVGFASLATTNVYIVQEFGVVTAVGIMIAYSVTIHFLPSSLDNLPPFRSRVLDAFGRQFSDRMMDRIAYVSEKRRWCTFVVTAVLLALSVAGILRIGRESSWFEDIRSDNAVYQAHDFFDANLTPVITLDLILRTDRTDGVHDLEALRQAERFQQAIEGWKHPNRAGVEVTQVLSYTDLLKEINRARLIRSFVLGNPLRPPKFEEIREKAKDPSLRRLPHTPAELKACLELYASFTKGHDLVARLTDDPFTASRVSVRVRGMSSVVMEDFIRFVREEHAKHAPSLRLMPTGKTWLAKRAMDSVITNMISSLGLAAVVIFGSMTILFRSLKVGLLSVIPNMLPMVFTAGMMGWLGIQLTFSTVTIFSVALGIAVDTTIHYLTRLRLEVPVDGDHTAAMYRTLRGAGRPMIFSTLLLILGFGSILTSSFKFTFHFGLLGGIAILTALLCDLFVTPAIMLSFKPAIGRWEKLEKKLQEIDQKLAQMLEKRGTKLD